MISTYFKPSDHLVIPLCFFLAMEPMFRPEADALRSSTPGMVHADRVGARRAGMLGDDRTGQQR